MEIIDTKPRLALLQNIIDMLSEEMKFNIVETEDCGATYVYNKAMDEAEDCSWIDLEIVNINYKYRIVLTARYDMSVLAYQSGTTELKRLWFRNIQDPKSIADITNSILEYEKLRGVTAAALDSKPSTERCEGSTPSGATI